MLASIVERLACWLGWHDWESRGGSFGANPVVVCRRCRKQSS